MSEPDWSDLKTAPSLLDAIERAKSYFMTPDEVFEQRVSFVYGMMSGGSGITKDRVREALRGSQSKMVRNQALEDAAAIVDQSWFRTLDEVAAAIRAAKDPAP